MPMVVPPADWGPEQQGGYVHHSYTLVKAQNLHEPGEYPDEEIHGPVVYSAVNGLQRTGWRINRKVLEVMQQVWAAGGGYAGLPTADPLPLPDKPAADATDEAVSRYRLLARQTHDENARIVAKRKNTLAKLRLAAEFVDCEEFFFPYQLDYRGRIYPVAPDLHPQADDIGRGLLEFSNGKRLGSHGLVWLKVRLANSFGVDDVSFADRVAWVDENWNRISLVAQDPMGFKWWTEAEDPWQALATCFELVVPEADLVSHLPVNVDGSCNGLQHFAAMQRDPVGAAVVNLVPKPKPDGIYYVVADKVQAVVDRDCLELQQSDPCAADDDPAPCQEWKATGVTKPVVKRGTMTLPYGVTKQGMQDQFIVDGL
jgi:DNA-directed RNA polymerase